MLTATLKKETGFMFFSDLFKIAIIVVWMFYKDAFLSMISLAIFPLLILATKYFQRAMKSAFEDERTAISKLNTFVQEHISGMKIVQIFKESTVLVTVYNDDGKEQWSGTGIVISKKRNKFFR